MLELLLKNVTLQNGEACDVQIEHGRIAAMGHALEAGPETPVIQAQGGALLPGLNDHHLHLAALAKAQTSVACGPPQVNDAQALAAALRAGAWALPAGQWLRGVGYHESVAGEIDRYWLDAVVADRPVRIQHRGGRLWILNSLALAQAQVTAHDPVETVNGQPTGRLLEADLWLRQRLGAVAGNAFPNLAAISQQLAAFGVTGLTDTTPQNDVAALALFRRARRRGELLQSLHMMGNASLDNVAHHDNADGVSCGAHKFHLLESQLPELDAVIRAVQTSHAAGRNVAFHCVTRTELVFALAALVAAGAPPPGCAQDRIEHASVAPPDLLEQIAALNLAVVTQPGFIFERGDRYLSDVETQDQPWLYRLQGVLAQGIALAGSSDAPFSSVNPWLAMHAAVKRVTRSGVELGVDERLSPEQALALYTSPLNAPGQPRGALQVGDVADLCLLHKPWAVARQNLAAVRPRVTFIGGCPICTSPSG